MHEYMIISLFCDVDDFCNNFEFKSNDNLLKITGKRFPKSRLSLSEIITIVVYFHKSKYRTFKHYYINFIQKSNRNWFNLVSYNRFIELMQNSLMIMIIFLQSKCMGKLTGVSFIDSTPICVCDNRRIIKHRVFKEVAKRGKTSTGYKFGFKLHLIINHLGEILACKLTTANVDDRSPVMSLSSNLKGKIYGDKGYISRKLSSLLKEKGINLITKVKKNMKEQLLSSFDKLMLKKRALIESVNDQLKNIMMIEHTRHRSKANFCVNLIAGLIAYSRQPQKPHIDINYCGSAIL